MLRIYDETDWRRRRRVLLLATFAGGVLAGGLMAVSAPAGSAGGTARTAPVEKLAGDCGDGRSGLKLACGLDSLRH